VTLPDPLVLRLPAYVTTNMEGVNEVWDWVAVAPAVVEEKALAYRIHMCIAVSAPNRRVIGQSLCLQI
jgi:hypothetical protein